MILSKKKNSIPATHICVIGLDWEKLLLIARGKLLKLIRLQKDRKKELIRRIKENL